MNILIVSFLKIKMKGLVFVNEVGIYLSLDLRMVYVSQLYIVKMFLNEFLGYEIQNLYKKVEQMQSIWQGVDHLAIQNQLEEFRPSLNEMYQVIQEYSNVLKQTASVYEQLQQDRVAQARLLL